MRQRGPGGLRRRAQYLLHQGSLRSGRVHVRRRDRPNRHDRRNGAQPSLASCTSAPDRHGRAAHLHRHPCLLRVAARAQGRLAALRGARARGGVRTQRVGQVHPFQVLCRVAPHALRLYHVCRAAGDPGAVHRNVQLGIGFVPQDRNVFKDLSVERNLRIAGMKRRNDDSRRSGSCFRCCAPGAIRTRGR